MKTTTINETLIKRLKEGNLDAFHQLYQQYSSEMVRLAFHFLKNEEEAEEAVQDIFLKIWEKRETINEKLAFQGFLYIVAKRILLNKVKAKSKYRFTEVNEWNAVSNSNMEEQLICEELALLSEKAISKLPSKRKEIYLMSREQKLTYNQIAQKLGISRKTVENQIVLALKGIKEHLQRHSDYSFSLGLLLLFL